MPLASSDPRLTFPSMKRSSGTLESGSAKERTKEDGIPQEDENVDVPTELTQASNPRHAVNMEHYDIFALYEDNARLALEPEDILNIDFRMQSIYH